MAVTSSSTPAVVAQHIVKRFGPIEAVRGASFSVPDRCVCGLLGPNGAGKSTTIRMLAGLLVPDEGSLSVAGFDLHTRADDARRVIGYLPESAPIHPELRVREFLAYRASLSGLSGATARDAIARAVEACNVESVYGRLAGALSKGFRQRVGLAAAILGEPRLIILDEPTAGLDPHQLVDFRRLVRDLSKVRTVLLSSHILAEIEATCDRAILLSQGRIVADGAMDELRGRGADRYVIEARGERIRATLAALPKLGAVREEAMDDGWRRIHAEGVAGNDLRAEIAAALANANCAVRELRRERASLESLFVAATAREALVA